MIRDLRDKVAVITGTASGIGAALAEGCAANGMRVVAADIDAAGSRATVARIEAKGGEALAVSVDVARGDSVAALADAAWDRFGQVDLLVNNAGVFQGGLSWERSVADWDWTLGVNLYGIIHAIRSFVPRMIAQDTEGHVVNTASVAAFVSGPMSSPYVVSKCAAFSLSECLAQDLEVTRSKIGASVLTPSTIDTGIASTARVRPAAYGTDSTPDAKVVAEGLAQTIATGIPPSEVVAPVLDAVRTGTFLIPTKPSFQAQIRNRYDALLERRIPATAEVD